MSARLQLIPQHRKEQVKKADIDQHFVISYRINAHFSVRWYFDSEHRWPGLNFRLCARNGREQAQQGPPTEGVPYSLDNLVGAG